MLRAFCAWGGTDLDEPRLDSAMIEIGDALSGAGLVVSDGRELTSEGMRLVNLLDEKMAGEAS
jgi:hypothetical protein